MWRLRRRHLNRIISGSRTIRRRSSERPIEPVCCWLAHSPQGSQITRRDTPLCERTRGYVFPFFQPKRKCVERCPGLATPVTQIDTGSRRVPLIEYADPHQHERIPHTGTGALRPVTRGLRPVSNCERSGARRPPPARRTRAGARGRARRDPSQDRARRRTGRSWRVARWRCGV